MELREKITKALKMSLNPDVIDLDDDGGISGIIVSDQFRGVTALDRQSILEKALRSGPVKLTKKELAEILAIAPLTSTEYHALGPPKRSRERSS